VSELDRTQRAKTEVQVCVGIGRRMDAAGLDADGSGRCYQESWRLRLLLFLFVRCEMTLRQSLVPKRIVLDDLRPPIR
jgi:hypothetical protein